MNSEIKPVIAENIDLMYFVKQSEDMFILIDESNYNELSESCYTEKIYPAAALEALQADHKENYLLLQETLQENAAQAKRIAELEISGDMKTELLSKCEAEIKILLKQIEELESGIGCTRSHPHENMNEVCKLKTDYAKQIFEDKADIEALRKQVERIKPFLIDCASPDFICTANTLREKANDLLDILSAQKGTE